jgi:hypothetical protein
MLRKCEQRWRSCWPCQSRLFVIICSLISPRKTLQYRIHMLIIIASCACSTLVPGRSNRVWSVSARKSKILFEYKSEYYHSLTQWRKSLFASISSRLAISTARCFKSMVNYLWVWSLTWETRFSYKSSYNCETKINPVISLSASF